MRPSSSNNWRSRPSPCIAVISSDPPIDLPCRITLGKVLRPVRRVSTALMKSPSSANKPTMVLYVHSFFLSKGTTSRTAQVNLDDLGLRDEIVLGQDLLCHSGISTKHVNNTTSRGIRSIRGGRHLPAICLYQRNKKKVIKMMPRVILNA